MNENEKKIRDLIEKLNVHIKNYYVLDKPTISDYEYDKMYDKLVNLEKQTGIVFSFSPTQRVGGETLKGFKQFEHIVQLYSLDKCQNFEDLKNWIEGIKKEFSNATFSVEYKYDGLSIVVEYENGILTRAGTRGNGKIGEDVTAQVKTIKSVPLSIPYKEKVVIQGEGMITLSNLEKYNKIATEPLKNARNAVAGAIRNLNPKETAKRNLDLFAYSVNYIKNKNFKTQEEENNFLLLNGFKTAGFFKVCNSYKEIVETIKLVEKTKHQLDILIDGIVIKLNEIDKREEFGHTSKFPKWAIAYKFEPEEVSTVLNDVVWQVGRTGKITPIGIVSPVKLAGATVSKATLNNMNDIEKKGVKIGSRVFIRRSNEVIPEILGIAEDLKDSKKIQQPLFCPSCSSSLSKIGANLFCMNVDCPEQIKDSLTHFCSKEAMNIEGLSEKTISQLYEKVNLKTISAIYDLTYDQLSKLNNFKEKKIQNLLHAIETSKNVSLSSFIYALGIKNVGLKTAKDLAIKFKTIDALFNLNLNSLLEIKDIGEIVAESIFNYFNNKENRLEIEKLFKKGVNIIKEQTVENSFFSGKNVVLTGTLLKYSRLEATKILEKNGAIVLNSVGKSTDIVIFGESAGSKLDKAKKMGITIINEEEFLKFFKK